MGEIILLAVGSAVFPGLLAGAAVILSRDRPEWLLVAFWLGGFFTSMVAGFAIVSVFGVHSEALSKTGSGLSPVHSIVIGLLVLVLAALLGTKRGRGLISGWRERRAERKAGNPAKAKRQPWTERVLGNGSVTIAGMAGAILNLPGPFYLIALSDIAQAGWGTGAVIGALVFFNLIMLTLVEVPIVGYLFSPERTDELVGRLSSWLNRNGIRIVALIALLGGLMLIGTGVQELA